MVVVLGGASAYRRCRGFGGKVPWIPSALYTSVTMENASLPVVTGVRTAGPCGIQLSLEGRANPTLLNTNFLHAALDSRHA